MGQYAKVPISAISDSRLTHRQFKVLCAIFSFADKQGNAHPSREEIAKRSGVYWSHVSTTTTELCKLGWLSKIGTGGKSRAARYRLNTVSDLDTEVTHKTEPELDTVTDSQTVSDLETVPNLDTRIHGGYPPVSDLDTNPVSDLDTGKEQTIEQTIEQTSYRTLPDAENSAPDAGQVFDLGNETVLQANCRLTWRAYSESYMNRYGVAPVRNSTVNTQIKNFVKRIGGEESPLVAAWYVGHNDSWYVKTGHSVGALLRDAEKLRTEWATNQRMTSTRARQIDATQSNLSAIEQAKQMAQSRNA